MTQKEINNLTTNAADPMLSSELLEEERLKGTRLSVSFRWFFILLTGTLLGIQLLLGHTEISKHGFTLIAVYFVTNLFFWYAALRKYNPAGLGYIGGTIDIAMISYHIYGMTKFFDPFAATATATIFLIPVIFMIYTFRLDRMLLLYLIIIAAIGFNLIYFMHYGMAPELMRTNISLSPISHIFKSVYITFIGLLCIYMQGSITRFIRKQLAEAARKNQLDAEIKIEQQKNKFAASLIDKEKALNAKLEEEIQNKDLIARQLKDSKEQIRSIISNQVGAVSRSLYDEHFTTKYYSEKIADITGYKAEDFIDNKNLKFVDIIYPDDLEPIKKQVRESIINNTPYSLEFRVIHKNGKVIWVQENGRPVYDSGGNILYLDGITTEITEKKNAEQALFATKRELEQLNRQLEKTVEERTARLTEANTQLLKMQKENLQSQFEVLKQQVNPHFLFNSLNVLTSLIKVNPDMAEVFTERLSKVYRYVLEHKEKDLVPLTTEMDCIRAYIFLLDVRFADKVSVNVRFDEKKMDANVVPLSLQLLIENAIKHNTFSKKSPLRIELFIDNDRYLNVTNNLQSRKTRMGSTGIGLLNISKRYALITDVQPVFEMTENQFVARIPLLNKD